MNPSPSTNPPMFQRLLALSREAHEHGQHETAYHALTAAMHAADDAGDVRALMVVRHEAQAQIAAIDHATPEHRLSTRSAARREHPGVYAMLARQASAHADIHQARELPGTSGSRLTP